jgi:phosphoribosyl 1,2-cyclic phosphodiesterase
VSHLLPVATAASLPTVPTLRVWVLGSGSEGNAVVLDGGAGSRILVDAGFPIRDLEARLTKTGVSPRDISSVVVTHAHGDHVAGVASGVRRHGWQVYASFACLAGSRTLQTLARRAIGFTPGDRIFLGTLGVRTIAVPHDSPGTVAVIVDERLSKARAAVVTDLGAIPDGLLESCRGTDMLVLESNHDPVMLEQGPYPASVRARIAGGMGHLHNAQAADFAAAVVDDRTSHIVLAHLSQQCNTARVARRVVGTALLTTAYRGRLHVSDQQTVLGPFVRRPPGDTGVPRPDREGATPGAVLAGAPC